MSLLRLAYDPQAKNVMKVRDPYNVEGDGEYILCSFESDRSTKEVPEKLDLPLGWVYCHYTNSNALMIGLFPTAWDTLFNHFTKKQVDGKWVDDAEKTAYIAELQSKFEANKGRLIIYCDGHQGVSEFIKYYHGQWVNVGLSVLTKDGDKITKVLKSIDDDNVDEALFNECFMGDWENSEDYTVIPASKIGKRNIPLLVDPESKEPLDKAAQKEGKPGIPLVSLADDLPVIRNTGSKRKSSADRYKENLNALLEVTGCKDFDALLVMAFENPVALQMHYGLLGTTLHLNKEMLDISISKYWDNQAKQDEKTQEEE